MSQNSLVVSNGSGASVRAAVNAALGTLATNNSGTGAPSTTYAYMFWADTTNDLLRIRNAANSAWITIGRLSLTNLGLSPIPRGHIWGMTLSNNGSDATNDIDIAAGSCASDDATDANRVLLNPGAMTKQLDAVWAAGSAAGGRISSESLVNGTWHVYAFRRAGGADDVCFSQSLTPTLPDGGTNSRRIGSILREGAAIVAFAQRGREFLRSSSVLDVSATISTTTANTRTLSVPTGIPVDALIRHEAVFGSTNNQAIVTALVESDQVPATSVSPLFTTPAYNIGSSAFVSLLRVRTNTAGQVRTRWANANGTEYIATYGWIDDRGEVS